jgi:hypothetical protein
MKVLRTLLIFTFILVSVFSFGCESIDSITAEKEDVVIVTFQALAVIWPPASGKGQVVRFDFNKNGGEPFMVERTNDQMIKDPPQYAEVSYNLHSGEQINIKVSIPNISSSEYLESNTGNDYLSYDDARAKAVPTNDKHIFKYICKREYALTLEPVVSKTSSASPSVITTQKPPIFTKADMVITGLTNLKIDDYQSRLFDDKTTTFRSLECTYVRATGQDMADCNLVIVYYFDVANANKNQPLMESSALLDQFQLQKLQSDPKFYHIIENDLGGTKRKTLLWDMPSQDARTIFAGKRLNRVDDHYIVVVSVTGTAFNGPDELKQLVDKFEQHGLDIVKQKKSQ